MSEIVLLGAASDTARIRKVVDGLHELGLDFWWATSPAGEQAQKLSEARCVVLFLTRASLSDPEFLFQAHGALARQVAIIARLDGVRPPTQFLTATLIDLRGYRGGKRSPALEDLLGASSAKAKGIDPPPPRGPLTRATKRALQYGVPFAVLCLGLVSDWFGASSGLQQFLSQFDMRQKRGYEAARTCAELNAFADRNRNGFYVELARDRVAKVKVTEKEVWRPETQRLVAYVGRYDQRPQPSHALAEADAHARMAIEARANCQDAAAQLGGRLGPTSFEPRPNGLACSSSNGGEVCALRAVAICTIEMETTIRREDCEMARD